MLPPSRQHLPGLRRLHAPASLALARESSYRGA